VRRQTYGYLPSRRASPPLGRYQIILLGDRGTIGVNNLPKVILGMLIRREINGLISLLIAINFLCLRPPLGGARGVV